eukprot:1011115-Karenia_brevis.AAC.1
MYVCFHKIFRTREGAGAIFAASAAAHEDGDDDNSEDDKDNDNDDDDGDDGAGGGGGRGVWEVRGEVGGEQCGMFWNVLGTTQDVAPFTTGRASSS